MPIHLPPVGFSFSRRRFLAGSVAATAAVALGRTGWAADAEAHAVRTDLSRVALLSDTHLAADKAKVVRETTMYANFEAATADVLTGFGKDAHGRLPSAVLINGDLAHDLGLPADYKTFGEAVDPFRKAGLPVHLNMGNHDNREAFWKALPPADAAKAVENRQISIVETPNADWIMLDSLETTKATPGLLGQPQLDWLAKALDARAAKNCIVLVHHNPNRPDVPKVAGLKDSEALLAALLPRKQVKALVFGHTHVWSHTSQDGLHLVNLPPVAYAFKAGEPSGWVDCKLAAEGATMTLRTIDPKHAKQNEVLKLAWRA